MNLQLSTLDWIALACFAACWWGFPAYAGWRTRSRASLLDMMNAYRRQWMRQVIAREMRIVDTSILASLGNSATFFSSTTILILGGLLAMLSTSEEILSAIGKLPLAVRTSAQVWEMKIVLMLAIFTYAFFVFTWSLRQFNFVAILVGAATSKGGDPQAQEQLAARAGRILEHAGESFSKGLRAYYFSLAALTWFVHPALFTGACFGVVAVLAWLEFYSDTARALREPLSHGEPLQGHGESPQDIPTKETHA
ncbi:MAG: DUF599 domain-containing protein [Betaproteobacteria bacterium]|nr:DUF599 domain-containing protein [Betaproteobacteria bacterium]